MEEAGLLSQLGINWKLLLSQAFNFFILLVVLHRFVYRPLLGAIKKRNEKIQEGLEKAQQADARLHEVDVIAKGMVKDAELESVEIIKATQEKAKQLDHAMRLNTEARQQELMAQVEQGYQKSKEEAAQKVLQGASELVKKLIVKTVELQPEAIDEALIKKAVLQLKDEV